MVVVNTRVVTRGYFWPITSRSRDTAHAQCAIWPRKMQAHGLT